MTDISVCHSDAVLVVIISGGFGDLAEDNPPIFCEIYIHTLTHACMHAYIHTYYPTPQLNFLDPPLLMHDWCNESRVCGMVNKRNLAANQVGIFELLNIG